MTEKLPRSIVQPRNQVLNVSRNANLPHSPGVRAGNYIFLSGMGPADPMKTSAGKIFAGCYALYSGLALVATTGIILAPVVHRCLHKFHVEDEEG